jgi:streptomycin 3"-adenylyltransferase
MDDPTRAQLDAALAAVRAALTDARMLGAYLYGSSVDGGLRPDSDLDVLVVIDRSLRPGEKSRVVAGLLPISGRDERPSSWRPLDVTVVALPSIQPWRYPPEIELQYGEWLRARFLTGEIEPDPGTQGDLGVLITTARQRSVALAGPPAAELVDPVPRRDLVRATLDGIPSLLDNVVDDTRNVLLTLARVWLTVATGEIRPKDVAADWAIEQLPESSRPLLARARDLYRDGGFGAWDPDEVAALADRLVSEISVVAARLR